MPRLGSTSGSYNARICGPRIRSTFVTFPILTMSAAGLNPVGATRHLAARINSGSGRRTTYLLSCRFSSAPCPTLSVGIMPSCPWLLLVACIHCIASTPVSQYLMFPVQSRRRSYLVCPSLHGARTSPVTIFQVIAKNCSLPIAGRPKLNSVTNMVTSSASKPL